MTKPLLLFWLSLFVVFVLSSMQLAHRHFESYGLAGLSTPLYSIPFVAEQPNYRETKKAEAMHDDKAR